VTNLTILSLVKLVILSRDGVKKFDVVDQRAPVSNQHRSAKSLLENYCGVDFERPRIRRIHFTEQYSTYVVSALSST